MQIPFKNIMQKTITISFMKEKITGRGEDSTPLSLTTDNRIYTGVFDGMGGSGASLYKDNEGVERTGAYIASRIVKKKVEDILISNSNLSIDSIINLLKKEISETLETENKKYQNKEKSALRSSLLRTFPTTLAVCSCEKFNESYKIDSIWAGDSRNYLLTDKGLFQLSIDDLNPQQDPYENLRNDAPLSNCICVDRKYILNHNTIETNTSCCIISATDGCFGYSLSPMHFEQLLLNSLKQSKSVIEWENELIKRIGEISGDDFSFSAFIIGYLDFKDFKDKLNQRYNILRNQLKKIENYQCEIKRFKKEIEEKETKLNRKKEQLEQELQKEWVKYKEDYLSKVSLS